MIIISISKARGKTIFSFDHETQTLFILFEIFNIEVEVRVVFGHIFYKNI